jgi:hypothetical protein
MFAAVAAETTRRAEPQGLKMIPNPDQLRAIAQMREGDLAQVPFAVLLHSIASNRKTVALEIEKLPLRKEIIFEKGIPVDCRSNLLHETLPRFMVQQGLLSDEQSQEFLAKAASQGLQFGEALILEGVVSASEIYRVLQQNLARKLLDSFSWRTGTFRVLGNQPRVESPLKVNAPQLVLTGIARFAPDEEINSSIGPLVGKKLFFNPSPPYSLDELRLSEAQQKLLALLEKGKRIDELAAETTVPFDEIMRFLYTAAVLGLVLPEDWLPKETEIQIPKAKPAAPAPRPSPPPAPAPAAAATKMAAADQDKLRNQLMEIYLRHRKQDSFELLGVAEGAPPSEVEQRFLEFSRLCAPWQFGAAGLETLVEKAEEVFLAGAHAFGELSDAEKRNTLLARRRKLREEKAAKPQSDRFAIKSELLDSEFQYKKGQALMAAGRYREARNQLQFAYDCDSANALYRAELAYCKFLDVPAAEAERSLEELKNTLRMDPKCGLAAYYMGLVQTELEQWEAGEQSLQKAIKLMMPDRRPIEGLKVLQERQQKKKRRFFG